MTTDLAIILGYVALQLLVGVLVSRGIRTESDYLLAGRRLGSWLATFTIFATWFGAETCVGAAGSVYENGLSGGSADPFGYAACMLLMGLVFAGPLWRRGLTTLVDLFRVRFGPGTERLAVLLMAPTSLLWAAAQIRAFGQVLTATSDLTLDAAILAATAVVIAYTVTGGLFADACTDLLQGVVLVIGLGAIAVAVIMGLDDAPAAFAAIPAERWSLLGGPDRHPLDVLEDWAVPILGSVVAQELVARVLACRSPGTARRSVFAATGLYLVVGLVPVMIGLLGPGLVGGLEDPEHVLPEVARLHLPRVLYLVFAGALVSAILSTVDSALLAAAALVSHNLVSSLRPQIADRTKVRVARAGVIVAGAGAWAIARSADSVHDLVEQASGFGSAGVLVLMVAGLFSRRGTPPGALSALAAGTLVWVAGTYGGDGLGAPEFLSERPFLGSLTAASLAFVIGSAVSRRRPVAV